MAICHAVSLQLCLLRVGTLHDLHNTRLGRFHPLSEGSWHESAEPVLAYLTGYHCQINYHMLWGLQVDRREL